MAQNMRAGMDEAEARRAARLTFGGVEQVKEECRDTGGWPALEQFFQDVRFGARMLRKNPGFTLTAVTTLALGIGVNAAVFTVTRAALFAGFPLVEKNDRIAYISSSPGCCVSWPDFEDWRAQAKSFEGMAIVHGTGTVVSDGNGTESFDTTEVSANTFRLVGQKPMGGRDFEPSDEIPGAPPVAILSYGFWDRRFGKDQTIVGKTLRMNGRPTRIIGIMPQGFSFPQKQDLWVPLAPTPEVRKREARGTWFAFGRLKDGVSLETARAEMATIGRRLGDAYPVTNGGRNLIPYVQNFNHFFLLENEEKVYWAMWGAVCFVLLIACANLANLQLVRALSRGREISVRIALGAGRGRIIRQLLIESLMLSFIGSVLGWWLARGAVKLYEIADRGPGMSSWRIFDYTMDYHVLGYLIAVSITTAFLFGMAPALRLATVDVNIALKEGGRSSTIGSRGKRLSSILVTAEMALALVLLTGAGVMVRSFLKVYNTDLGAQTSQILTMPVGLPTARYPKPEEWARFFSRLRSRLESMPGVESAALTNLLPTDRAASEAWELAGAAPVDERSRPKWSTAVISPDYFRTLGTPVLAGREFSARDTDSAIGVVLVNRKFAERAWPAEVAIGKRLRPSGAKTPQPWLTVIGLVPNIAQNGASREEGVVYLPYTQRPASRLVAIARTGPAPASLSSAFQKAIHEMDSELPVHPVTLTTRLEGRYWTKGLYGVLFAVFAGLALLLACIGLYGVIAHSVGQRAQEIGVRMAIGATARDIRELILRQGMLPLAMGLSLGLVAAFALTPVLKSLLVQVSPADPVTFVAAPLVLMLAALLGCLIPARRAARVDPLVALRNE